LYQILSVSVLEMMYKQKFNTHHFNVLDSVDD